MGRGLFHSTKSTNLKADRSLVVMHLLVQSSTALMNLCEFSKNNGLTKTLRVILRRYACFDPHDFNGEDVT